MSARPLSPHLSVYRFMYTMALSILHRISCLLLSLGLLVLIYWLMSASLGELSYGSAVTVLSAPLFRVLLLGWLAAYAYHFCNGIRHLLWDVGVGFEKKQARASAWIVIIAALLITAVAGYLLLGSAMVSP
jgi:succinate dehydrogenase / fumarate reductase, cytochrome b subunit